MNVEKTLTENQRNVVAMIMCLKNESVQEAVNEYMSYREAIELYEIERIKEDDKDVST